MLKSKFNVSRKKLFVVFIFSRNYNERRKEGEKQMLKKYNFNYSFLRGWIRNTLGNEKKYAIFLGISPQALNKKLNGKTEFSISQVKQTQEQFNLNASEVNLFYLNTSFSAETVSHKNSFDKETKREDNN